ncbi:MAG: hypothetical protein KatS3mg104_0939 [Phycisphaerae bacterium]|nr:MAG: hypothetical protein KatS3mg104_0939 [Phycisphaerae bacterium]
MRFWNNRRRSIVLVLISAGLLTLLFTEVIGRQLGLCDPVLSMSDPDMEYRFAPNQECHIRGKTIKINSFSMRSDEVDPHRSHILFLGDSVIWGGTMVDQSELASTLVEQRLGVDRVQVLNVSAGSWGPPNLLAYVRKFGTFDAKTAIIVVSSQDANDAMTFVPLVGVNSSFPDRKPVSVTLELIRRYIPRFLELATSDSSVTSDSDQAIDESVMESLKQLIQELCRQKIRVIVVMHPLRAEVRSSSLNQIWSTMKNLVQDAGGEWVDARLIYKTHLDRGQQLYRDTIHLNVAGQQALAEVILWALNSR